MEQWIKEYETKNDSGRKTVMTDRNIGALEEA